MPTKRQVQALQTRQKLIDAGQRLLSEKGYDNVTIADITRECGVAKGTFYVYFSSKEQLFGTLQYAPYLELDDGLATDDRPIGEVVSAYMVAWIEYFAQYSPSFAASWLGHTNSENLGLLEDYKDEYDSESGVANARVAKIAARLRRAVEEGELSEACPVEEVAFSVATRLYGLCVWHSLANGRVDIVEGVRREADLVCKLLASYR